MRNNAAPAVHPDAWVDMTRAYVTEAVQSLCDGGLTVTRSWLDPRNPRDATIIFADPASNVSAAELALVWDEVAGWRRGGFQSGRQGERTVLSDVSHLGGGVLPTGREMTGRLLAGISAPDCAYRSVTDLRDGLDDVLQAYSGTMRGQN